MIQVILLLLVQIHYFYLYNLYSLFMQYEQSLIRGFADWKQLQPLAGVAYVDIWFWPVYFDIILLIIMLVVTCDGKFFIKI